MQETLKKRHSFIAIVAIFFMVCGLMCSASDVFAQEEQDEEKSEKAEGVPDSGLQLSPTKFIWTLKEGASKSDRINVKNYSDVELSVHVEVEDFFVGEDGSKPNFYVPDAEHPLKALDIVDWITPPEDFILGPGEAKWVDFDVNIPAGQPTNGYYGSILFKTGGVDGGESEGSKIGISYRIAALVILAVQGDEPMAMTAEFKEFYPEKNIFWETPASLKAKILNTGNIHFPMFGEITVNKFGKKFHEIELKPQLIYPKIDRDYTQRFEVSWWDFGKYTADLSMWSEDEKIRFDEQTTFWVIPWKGLTVFGGGLLVLFIFSRIFKKYVHIGSKPQQKK